MNTSTRNNIIYLLLAVFSVVCVTAAVVKNKQKEEAVMPLKNRTGKAALGSEWQNTAQAIGGYLDVLRKDPDNVQAKVDLAMAYLQEARITGDHAYYDVAALRLVNSALKKDPNNFEALCIKGTIYASQHHFTEALALAQQAVAINPHNAFVYGILIDANVELGNYAEAVKMADKMSSVRPDIRSYSRISYLREIHGDYPGAIQAMDMAVKAGYPGLEQTEWTRVGMGHLYEITGDTATARGYYQTAAQLRSNYPYALAGLGRLAKLQKNYPKAIEYFEEAKVQLPDYSFSEELIDLYALNNEPQKQAAALKEAIAMLTTGEHDGENDEEIGHYADRELAYIYIKSNELDKALEHALMEYNRRPNNIDVNEVMAWAHYKKGEADKALPYIEKALSTGSKNAVLQARAALIYAKNNQLDKAQQLAAEARQTNPLMDETLRKETEFVVSQFLKVHGHPCPQVERRCGHLARTEEVTRASLPASRAQVWTPCTNRGHLART